MKILLVCYDSPLNCSYGAGLRTHHIWNALKTIGDVKTLVMEPSLTTQVAAYQHEAELARIFFKKPKVPWVTPETKKIRELISAAISQDRFDLVVVRYLRLAMLIQPCITARIIVDGDDLNKSYTSHKKSAPKKALDWLKTQARRAVTRREVQRFDHVWYVNPVDKQLFPAKSGSLLPNVTRMPKSSLPLVRAEQVTLLMVGKMSYEPNTEGADFFIREVLPALRIAVPNAKLRLVGQCTPELSVRWGSVPGVEVAGFVDDLSLDYSGAWVVVAPVFSGGGTQIKVLEALSYGCATVVSDFSAAGFAPHLIGGVHMLVANSAQVWIEHCLTLIKSPARAAVLGTAGREAIAENYSNESIRQEVEATVALVMRGLETG